MMVGVGELPPVGLFVKIVGAGSTLCIVLVSCLLWGICEVGQTEIHFVDAVGELPPVGSYVKPL